MDCDALELRAWIRLADERGLIATIDDFAALPKGVPTRIVPLEYSKFLLHEYPNKHPVPVQGARYTPADFFTPLLDTFTRTKRMANARLVFHDGNGGIARGLKPQVVGRLVFADGEICEQASIHSTRANRQAESGSGDGYSRYILWARLAGSDMPRVYNGPGYG